MRLHTKLTQFEVGEALARAKEKGLVTPDVHFVAYGAYQSQSHERAFEVQLGTYDKFSLPEGTRDQHGKNMKVRRFKNSGNAGADHIYSATWYEWGWFIKEVFDADPEARFGGNPEKSSRPQYVWGYFSPEDFHEKTKGAFEDE